MGAPSGGDEADGTAADDESDADDAVEADEESDRDDTDGGTDPDAVIAELVRDAVGGQGDAKLRDVDAEGPRVTVVVEHFVTEEGARRSVGRTLYAVAEEPDVELEGDRVPFDDETHLHWYYLGPVADDADERGNGTAETESDGPDDS